MVVALTACSAVTEPESIITNDVVTTTEVSGAETEASGSALAATDSGETQLTSADVDWDGSDEITITLSDGESRSDSTNVTIDGDVITIGASGTYRVSGALSDGQIVVDAVDDGLVRLVLNGIDVTNSTTAPLLVENAGEVVVWLADGSQNRLDDPVSYVFADSEADGPNAALYSTARLTIAGTGSLAVEGNFTDGITSKDDLVIIGGAISVTAIDDGIRGKDSLVVNDGTISVQAGGDALTSDGSDADGTGIGIIAINGGTLDLSAGTDGIDAVDAVEINGGVLSIAAGDDAVHADASLSVNGGAIQVTSSYEGLESAIVTITGADINIVSSDDGINVAGGNDGSGSAGPGGDRQDNFAGTGNQYAEISGGTIVVYSDGDGIDINGSITITGGTIVVNGPTANNNGALDVDGSFEISNALLVAAGSAGMAESPDQGSGQPSLSVQFQAPHPARTVIQIATEDGTTIAVFESSKSIQSIVFSSPELSAGTNYVISLGAAIDGGTLGGLVIDGSATGGTAAGTVSTS